MTKFALVRIMDVPYHSDKVYEYSVPPQMAEEISVGSMVSVNFGFGDRKCKAVVTGVSCESTSERELKPINAVMHETPTMSESELSLCKFLCDYTLCTFGEAAKTVIPSAAFSKYEYRYSAVDELSPNKAKKLSKRALMLYGQLRRDGTMTHSKIKTLHGDKTAEIVSELLTAKAIKKETEIKESTNVKHIDKLRLKCDDIEAAKLSCSRSAVQIQIIEELCQNGEMDSEALSAKLGKNVRVQLSSLEKKGIITLEREVVYRNPYKNAGEGYSESPLSDEQQGAVDKMCALFDEDAPKAALLHGVTGSGKTRVVKAMIDHALEKGKGVIVLVPEISLTPQTVGIFCSCYGERCAVLHSALSKGERYDAWRRIREGEADVVIGTRSAVFAPVKNLGMIVIDEEQEHTYKSDTDPKYLAHDVARFRVGKENAFMLLSSATPSVTSYYKAVSGAYTLVELKNRYGNATLPDVVISDMRGERSDGNVSPVGSELLTELSNNRYREQQSIVFLNRRGYNSAVSCRVCGEAIKCPNCSVSLTYHINAPIFRGTSNEDYARVRAERGSLSCHYCGYKTSVPQTCPSCSAEHFRYMGCGTQQAEEEIAKLLPGVKISRMDMDTTSTKHSYEKILKSFRRGDADILLGTQMVTKGHDFPNVTLVGVMNADASLFLDDYTAAEKTFSMLTQVIGRAGRGDKKGIAVIQTCNPDSPVIRLAAEQDYKSFYEKEITVRRALTFPPYCDIAVINMISPDESMLKAGAESLSEYVRGLITSDFSDVELIAFGPFDAPVYKVQNNFRMRMIFKCRLNAKTRKFFSRILREFGAKTNKGLRVSADFNPSGL